MTSYVMERFGVHHEIDPSILARIDAREARLPARDWAPEVQATKLQEQGTYMLIEPEAFVREPALTNEVTRVFVDALSNERFNPDDPMQSMVEAVWAANDLVARRGGAFQVAVFRAYHDADGKMAGVAATVGAPTVAKHRTGLFGKATAERIADGDDQRAVDRSIGSRLDGTDECLNQVLVGNIPLTAKDRVVLASAGIVYDDTTDKIDRQKVINVTQEKDIDSAARMVVGSLRTTREKVAVVLDVLRKRRRGTVAMAAGGAALGGAIAASENSGGDTDEVLIDDRGAGVDRASDPARAAEAATAAGVAGSRRRRMPGAGFVGGVRDFGRYSRDSYRTDIRRQTEADYEGRKRTKLLLGATALGAGYGMWRHDRNERRQERWARWYEKQRLHPRYAEGEYAGNQALIDQDIERRRRRNVLAICAAIIGGILVLKGLELTHHLDLNWGDRDPMWDNSGDPIVPSVKTSNTFDILPSNMDGDGMSIAHHDLHWTWNDDFPFLHLKVTPGHAPYYDPGSSGGSGGAPRPDWDLPSRTTHPGPTAPAPVPVPRTGDGGSSILGSADHPFAVSGKSAYTNSIEGLIHQEGHQLVGERFTGADAHRVFEAARDRFGNDFVRYIDGSQGPNVYTLPNGDPGLGHSGELAWDSLTVSDFIRDRIRETVPG